VSGRGRGEQTFSVESHFPAVSPSCVFQVLSLSAKRVNKKEEKALDINICGTLVT